MTTAHHKMRYAVDYSGEARWPGNLVVSGDWLSGRAPRSHGSGARPVWFAQPDVSKSRSFSTGSLTTSDLHSIPGPVGQKRASVREVLPGTAVQHRARLHREVRRPSQAVTRLGGAPQVGCLWAMLGSNQRPLPCEGSALPLSQSPVQRREDYQNEKSPGDALWLWLRRSRSSRLSAIPSRITKTPGPASTGSGVSRCVWVTRRT
jgi:hypothetical protein